MKRSKKFYEMVGRILTIYPELKISDVELLSNLRKYLKKHHRICEFACNGEGVIRGKFYRLDSENAYIDSERTVFDLEIEKIEEKIRKILKNSKFNCKFQHDPRGYTAKIFYKNKADITCLIW